jgi:hypothetical protein
VAALVDAGPAAVQVEFEVVLVNGINFCEMVDCELPVFRGSDEPLVVSEQAGDCRERLLVLILVEDRDILVLDIASSHTKHKNITKDSTSKQELMPLFVQPAMVSHMLAAGQFERQVDHLPELVLLEPEYLECVLA